jgi:hypothetical protein
MFVRDVRAAAEAIWLAIGHTVSAQWQLLHL